DPVFMAKRGSAKDHFHEVDLPYMLLRLRQGIGRLIRTSSDTGIVSILYEEASGSHQLRPYIESVMPEGILLEELIL
ncbi:ATP-dependent DNA helicase, partial [Paenibacillus sepulcri]|nr:ATP-dependent DNA helicase [Paenibacillus sepulcri]